MAALMGLPVADGMNMAARGGNKADGLFGLMVTQELARLAAPVLGEGKQEGQGAGNPMMALLMQAFMAGLAQGSGTAPGNGTEPTTGTETQSDPPEAVEAAAEAQAAVYEGAQPQAIEMAVMLLQLLFPDREQQAALKELAAAKEAGGSAPLKALAAALQNEVAANPPAIVPAGQEQEEFASLFQALADAGDGTAAGRAAKGMPRALEEIRQLFLELIDGGQPAGQPPSAEAAPEQDAVDGGGSNAAPPVDRGHGVGSSAAPPVNRGHDVGKPADIAGMLVSRLETLIKGIRAIQAASGQSLTPITAQARSQSTTEAVAVHAGQAAPDTEPVEQTQESAVIHTAMRAYHANGPVAVPAASAEHKAVAEAARPGAEAFENIVESIRSLTGAAHKEMEIQLKPEFLGKVTIRLTMDEGGLVARITAANPRVADSFQAQAGTLQASLTEQGLRDVRVVVAGTTVQDPSLQQQTDRRGHGQHQQQKRGRFAVEAPEQTGGRALLAYEALYSTGTVNYLA